jgi:hypothetical protein
MRRRGFSWFVVLLLTGALGATAALAASFAHRTRLDDWALGRFVPPPPDRRAAEAGGPSFSAMTQLAMEEVSAAKWPVHLALRVERVDVRGPWPLSALLQEFFESGAVPGQGCPVLSLVRAGPGGAMEGFGGVAFPRQTPRGFFHSMLPEPFVAGFGAEPVDCRASVVPGAERCLGLASPGPADVIVLLPRRPAGPDRAPRPRRGAGSS